MSRVRRFGLVGDPVRHSLSPRLYEAAFAVLGVAASYEAHHVPAGDTAGLESMMRELGATGGGNVTVPHKRRAARHLDVCSPVVEATGACNCFWLDSEGRLAGDNTDVGGFLGASTELPGLDFAGASVLLLGAGGAARAVAVACARAGVGALTVKNRTASRASELVAELGLAGLATVWTATETRAATYDLVVNATSLGLHPDDPLPLSLEGSGVRHVFDLVYGPGGTPWTRHAMAAGIPAIDGFSMLVHQAVLSLEQWFGKLSDPDPVVRAMRLAAAGALRADTD